MTGDDAPWVVRLVEERFHRDVEGRPIREGRTPREYLRDGDIEYRTCPYAGSRQLHARPMNVSALRQTSAHWDAILDTLALLQATYVRARGDHALDLIDVWRVSQLGSALPWFYLLHERTGVPAATAALAKATLGVGIWAQRIYVDVLAGVRAPPQLAAAPLVQLAEHSGTLIGDTEVCSASDKMLHRFFAVLVDRAPAFADDSELARRRDHALRFGAHYIALKQLLWLYHLARRFLYADLAHRLAPTAPEAAQLAALRDAPIEPPDFFAIEPPDPAALAPAQRRAWFHALAALVVPLTGAPTELALRAAADALADTMGAGGTPVETFARLDALFADVLAAIEAGLRGEPAPAIAFDAGARDRLLASEPRALFASLAGRGAVY